MSTDMSNTPEPGSITLHLNAIAAASTEEKKELARTELWKHGYKLLVNLARRYVSWEDAEEVVCDTFRKLFERIESGKLTAPENRQQFWSLVRTMAEHGALNRLRSLRTIKRGGKEHFASSEELDQKPVPDFAPEDVDFLSEEAPEDVWRFLELLEELSHEPLLRDLAFMHHYEGQSQEAICAELGISRRTFFRKEKLLRMTVELYEEKSRRD